MQRTKHEREKRRKNAFWERCPNPKGHARRLLNRRNRLGGRVPGKDFSDGFRELGTITSPIGDAVVLQIHGGRSGAGVVGTYDFHGAAIAGAVLFDDNDAVVGLLARSNTR